MPNRFVVALDNHEQEVSLRLESSNFIESKNPPCLAAQSPWAIYEDDLSQPRPKRLSYEGEISGYHVFSSANKAFRIPVEGLFLASLG